MTFARRTWIILAVVFAFFAMPAAAYLAQCSSYLREPEFRLVIENRMSTDVTIVNEDMNENGERVLRLTLGTIPAGQTEELTLVKPSPEGRTPDRPKKPVVATCELRAEDPAWSVVWEMSWSEDEFDDLAKNAQTIVIGPQSDSQEGSQ